MEDLASLNDEDLVKIGQVSHELQKRYGHKQWHSRDGLLALMDQFRAEAQERFLEIGFGVTVDTTPMLANQPPVVSIASRHHAFDPEKKQWEVRKAEETAQRIYGEDKNPMGKTVTGE